MQGGFFFHPNEQRSLAEDPVEGKTTQTPGFLKEQKLIKRKIDTPRGLGGGRGEACLAGQAAEKGRFSGEIGRIRSSGAKAISDSIGFMRGLKPPPPSKSSFSAACGAHFPLFHGAPLKENDLQHVLPP